MHDLLTSSVLKTFIFLSVSHFEVFWAELLVASLESAFFFIPPLKNLMQTVTSESNRIKTFIVPPLSEFIFC